MTQESPYQRGINAALRIEEYEGATDVPACPYPGGTWEFDSWHDGFSDGTEDLIAYKRSTD